MPAATIFRRSALPGAGVGTETVDLDCTDGTADADGIGALSFGGASFSYHRIPDRDLDLDVDDNARANDALSSGRGSFSYRRLSEPLLQLTIRKLDGSCFDVQIARSATVRELRATIEGVFIAIYGGREEDIISWQQVWSHFCLCFKDEKLTDDKAKLGAFDIKDGDELHFTQHLSVDSSPRKSSKSQKAASHRRSRTSLDDVGRSITLLDDLNEQDEGENKVAHTRHSTSVLEEGVSVHQFHVECLEEGCKKRSFFHCWCSRFRSNSRTDSEDVARSSCENKSSRPKLGRWLSL